MARTGYVYSDTFLRHDTGTGHPERADRLVAVRDAVAACGLPLVPLPCAPASRGALERVHTPAHVDAVRHACELRGSYPDPDTNMGEGSWEAALLAAGAGIAAARAVLDGEVNNAFCAVRPPGHHAEADRAMGFCLFNNVAVTARWLQCEGGVKRVAILDWDVHHGNGTQHAFFDDESVLYVSLHQHPHYPGTGQRAERGAGGTTVNIPLPWDAGRDAWVAGVCDEARAVIARFAPGFLLLSAGFDAHRRDPLSMQNLETADYAAMTRGVRDLADGRVVSLLEGGYDCQALSESVVAHLAALSGQDPPEAGS